MQKRRVPSWLPDFGRGRASISVAVFGVLWTIAAIVYKQHWIVVVAGILVTIRGVFRSIENLQAEKEEKKKAEEAKAKAAAKAGVPSTGKRDK